MRTFEKFILWIYAFSFSLLMLLLALMTIGWRVPIYILNFALTDFPLRWLIGISGIILFLVGFYVLFFNFRMQPITHTVVKTTQLGDVCISIDAIQALVIKAAGKVLGIREIKPVIKPTEQGIAVLIKGTVNAEESIPQMSVALQETVKETVEAITGVAVIEVRVFIQGVAKDLRGRVE